MEFMGYRRPDGRVGVRNYLAIIPSVFCANTTVRRIAAAVPGAVALAHPVGCAQVGLDLELTARTLKAMACHPNVGAVLVVGLGCERFPSQELYEAVRANGKPCAHLSIQEEGGTTNTVARGIELAKGLKAQVDAMQRVPCDVSELIIATKCGGTDATSGLAANPAVGNMADRVVAEGGSAILSECNELLGTEDMLAKRAVSPEVAKKVYSAIYEIEDLLRNGRDTGLGEGRNELISPGNFAGGVSSVVEKALGGVHKSGTSPIVDVLQYATAPEKGKHGLFLMDYESHDGEVVTGMIGCGAQIVAFTTGRGNPTGHPLAPVIKVTGNYKTYAHMQENFDFDASGIIQKGESVEENGERLFDLVLKIANGQEKTTAEAIGGDELFCIGRRHGYHLPEEFRMDCGK
ncbi:MAG: UxaA family hydrolase [Lachnospiraceae bacterium]|nr:UxaA family hydrolase [Lachnospiraceae bacterium]